MPEIGAFTGPILDYLTTYGFSVSVRTKHFAVLKRKIHSRYFMKVTYHIGDAFHVSLCDNGGEYFSVITLKLHENLMNDEVSDFIELIYDEIAYWERTLTSKK